MKIQKNTVASFFYELKEENGEQLETNTQGIPMAYLHGHNNLLAGLESELEGLSAKESKTITLPPEKAYGPRREGAVQRVPIKHLASKHKRLLPGAVVKVQTEKGPVTATAVKVGKFNVDVDFNHPFAGKTLVFDITVEDVREATQEEIAHGHAHGVGGHHH